MTDTCDFCQRWVVKTWEEHRNRLANMRAVPNATTNPCPRCGGTYWAIQPPPGLPPERPRVPPGEPRVDVNTVAKVIGLASAAILLAALFLLVMSYRAHAQTTFRDAAGRQIGTATRDSNGTTTYRDGSGRQTGSSSTNSNGTTTFRDGSGRMTGTSERRR